MDLTIEIRQPDREDSRRLPVYVQSSLGIQAESRITDPIYVLSTERLPCMLFQHPGKIITKAGHLEADSFGKKVLFKGFAKRAALVMSCSERCQLNVPFPASYRLGYLEPKDRDAFSAWAEVFAKEVEENADRIVTTALENLGRDRDAQPVRIEAVAQVANVDTEISDRYGRNSVFLD